MKLDSINGKGTGKSGSKVYYVNHGMQIEREYTSQVNNPNTDAQLAQRARFKLASQVSAIMEEVVAIPRKGMQSPRNRFTAKNMQWFYGSNAGASVTYENLQITEGVLNLPPLKVDRQERDPAIVMALSEDMSAYLSRVIYNVFKKTEGGLVQFVTSSVVNLEESNGYFRALIADMTEDIVILAYGMKDRNEAATAKYSSYVIESGADIAKLIITRKLRESDYRMTITRGAILFANQDGNVEPEESKYLLNVSTTGPGNIIVKVAGQTQVTTTPGVYQVTHNAAVELDAVPLNSYMYNAAFIGWFENGEQQIISRDNPLTFSMSRARNIVAKFGYINLGGGLE